MQTNTTRQLFVKQNATNELFVGKEWLIDPKVRNEQAILDEANELRVSMGWAPWWKGQAATDLENVKMEIIDILHFHISGMLKECNLDINGDDFDPSYIEEIIDQANGIFIDCVSQLKDDNDSVADSLDYVSFYLGDLLTHGFTGSTLALLELANSQGMSVQDMVDLYIVKNVLNKFRKEHNYKGDQEGSPAYRKMIDGLEDNVHVVRLAKEMGQSITFDGLYDKYEEFYSSVNGEVMVHASLDGKSTVVQ